MITLSVVIYIIFLLTSTSLFVVANTTIEPYLDGEYVKKNITIDPEHLKSKLEKVIEHDKAFGVPARILASHARHVEYFVARNVADVVQEHNEKRSGHVGSIVFATNIVHDEIVDDEQKPL